MAHSEMDPGSQSDGKTNLETSIYIPSSRTAKVGSYASMGIVSGARPGCGLGICSGSDHASVRVLLDCLHCQARRSLKTDRVQPRSPAYSSAHYI